MTEAAQRAHSHRPSVCFGWGTEGCETLEQGLQQRLCDASGHPSVDAESVYRGEQPRALCSDLFPIMNLWSPLDKIIEAQRTSLFPSIQGRWPRISVNTRYGMENFTVTWLQLSRRLSCTYFNPSSMAKGDGCSCCPGNSKRNRTKLFGHSQRVSESRAEY